MFLFSLSKRGIYLQLASYDDFQILSVNFKCISTVSVVNWCHAK